MTTWKDKRVETDDLVLATTREVAEGRVGILTLNRPDQRNPLDNATLMRLETHLDGFLDDPGVRAVVITGAPPAFSAGGDLRAYLDLYEDEASFRDFLARTHRIYNKLETSRLFSIAAINGVCVAGGFEMALACDLIVMADQARLGDAHLKFWQLPGAGGTQRLPRAVGFTAAKRLLYGGELLTAKEAHGLGLTAATFPADELIDGAVELAERISAVPEDTIVAMKGLLQTAAEEPLSIGLQQEIETVVAYTSGNNSSGYAGLLRFLDEGSSNGPRHRATSSQPGDEAAVRPG